MYGYRDEGVSEWGMKNQSRPRGTNVTKTKDKRKRHSLLIQGATTAGWRAILEEGPGEFLVETVCHRSRDSFPHQDEDHQHSGVTAVPWPPADQTQQLLFFAVSPNHLSNCAQIYQKYEIMNSK